MILGVLNPSSDLPLSFFIALRCSAKNPKHTSLLVSTDPRRPVSRSNSNGSFQRDPRRRGTDPATGYWGLILFTITPRFSRINHPNLGKCGEDAEVLESRIREMNKAFCLHRLEAYFPRQRGNALLRKI